MLKYQPSCSRTLPKSWVPRTWPPIRKKTPTGARLMTQVVMVIIASEREVKKSSRGFPFSPSFARDTPNTMANMIKPRMLGPFVHSPRKGKRMLLNTRKVTSNL